MKTPSSKLIERGPDGAYPDSLGQHLSSNEKRQIRTALCESAGPLHLTALAARAGVSIYSPAKQQGVAQFVETYLVGTKECRMAFQKNRKGQDVFAGWEATEHGRDLLEKGLV